MRKILLTSAGFETKVIEKAFLDLTSKSPKNIKALFIPTASISPAAISVLPKCMNDLLKINIPPKNIRIFDLHRSLNYKELADFDIIYFTGGKKEYLLNRINKTGFKKHLKRFIDEKGIYIGVSAGSIIAANNLPNNLGLINCKLSVHHEIGSNNGIVNTSTNLHIKLTDNQAILIIGETVKIIE